MAQDIESVKKGRVRILRIGTSHYHRSRRQSPALHYLFAFALYPLLLLLFLLSFVGSTVPSVANKESEM